VALAARGSGIPYKAAVIAGLALQGWLLMGADHALAQDPQPDTPPAEDTPADQSTVERPDPPTRGPADTDVAAETTREPWIDRMQQSLYIALWRSAMGIDRMFGSKEDASAYQTLSGSIAPALLWDEFDGYQPRLRFRINLPLPQLSNRFDAFVGRVNREEYVTERQPESGAFAGQRGTPVEDDETLLGIRYHEPGARERFTASGGVRVATPLDPYIKGTFRFQRGHLDEALLTLRETAFWQNSEDFGFTTRADLEQLWEDRWLLRLTASGTISQESQGVRGYAGFTALREFPGRRAAIVEVFGTGEKDADVPLRDYGIKLAWRKSVTRDWLVLELRTGVTWPKEERDAPRAPSWALGIGFEIFFGTEEFEGRPVTF
jgi:hypothetical protein